MKHQFQNSSILIVNMTDSSRKMLLNVLRLLGVKDIDEAFVAGDAFRKFKEKKHDIILAALENGVDDAVALTKLVRTDQSSPNTLTPVIATTGPKTLHFVDAARDAGVTDVLQAPHTVDDVATRLNFVTSMPPADLEIAAQPQDLPEIEMPADAPDWPNEEESQSLTDILMDHYIKHHEIVLTKLKFAQTATQQSIEEIRSVHENLKGLDNTNIHEFTDFEKMWGQIIELFVQGGLSEEELFEIEKIITKVPKEIKQNYDTLTQQDKSFLALVESLNTSAYHKAKAQAIQLQALPNPLHGNEPAQYTARIERPQQSIEMPEQAEAEPGAGEAFLFHTTRKKKK